MAPVAIEGGSVSELNTGGVPGLDFQLHTSCVSARAERVAV